MKLTEYSEQARRDIKEERRSREGLRYDEGEIGDLVNLGLSERKRLLEAEISDISKMNMVFGRFLHGLLSKAQESGFPNAEFTDFHYDKEYGTWDVVLHLGGATRDDAEEKFREAEEKLKDEMDIPEGFFAIATPEAD